MQTLFTPLRSSSSLLQMLAFPAAIALVFLFSSQLFPLLPHAFQESIRHGAAGLYLAYAATLVLIGSAALTLQAFGAPAAKATSQSVLDRRALSMRISFTGLRSNLNLLKMLAFPAVVVLIILFQMQLFPVLPYPLQEAVHHGVVGLFLAYVAGLGMVISAALTWQAVEASAN